MKTPAYRYANMTNDEAFAELDKRGILYTKEKAIGGVRAPIRLTGRLHGVLVRSVLPPEQRTTTMFEILDARLALSLDDFAAVLAEHDVDEVVHFTMYRPNVKKPDAARGEGDAKPAARSLHPAKRRGLPIQKGHAAPAPAAKKGPLEKGAKSSNDRAPIDATNDTEAAKTPAHPAKKHGTAAVATPHTRARSQTKADAVGHGAPVDVPASELDDDKPQGLWAPPGTRHPAGLAIDVGILLKKDGTRLSVASDFEGKIGAQTCGTGAPSPVSAPARELRDIVCTARDKGIFTYTLTPNFNAAHRDHFHMEIKPGVLWFLYQ